MKKVVYVVESFAAGVYTFLTDLCNSMAEENEVVIIHSLREETPQNFSNDFNPDIKFIQIDMCRGLNPYKNIKSLFQLKKELKKEKPDVVHLHSSKAGFLGRIVCYLNRFDMDKVFYNPHGFSFLQQNESRFKRSLFYVLEVFANTLGGCTVGCSEGEFREAGKISRRCIHISNAIDTVKIDEIIGANNFNASEGNNKLKIGTIGRICRQKNPELFNEIAKSFNQYDFLWIGDGDLRSKLDADNIKVTGWLKRSDVIEKLESIDIFILTSLWEGLPISLLEAMYIGKPVIVSNVMGNKDVVQNNINGFIANNMNEYIETIKYIVSNNIISDLEFKTKVRNDISRNYEKRQMIEKYIKIYE